ncbi:TPA: hypothetical protein ACH3X3_007951 [Trebouxia sp. C0006]
MLLNTVPRLPVVQPLQRIGCVRCVIHAQRSNGSCLLERPVARQRIQSLISSEQTPFYVANSASPPDNKSRTDFELSVLIEVLPARVRNLLQQHPDLPQLVEVVLDLGRPVLARFANTDQLLSAAPLAKQELEEVTSKVSDFGGDNRAGIDRCLHRISCIRNRDGQIVGLTCRVGRAIAGSANMAADVVLSGKSILLLGRPGVGKTTAIRDISSMLAHVAHKRVVIIDTSNEIAGDGDVPHPGIASARRMQVPVPEQQHRVMIEAVENHMPEVIVIDEIGSEAEALAAATIAQRGVQLVATAHGERLENILNNPTLQSLLGGVESVTLGDEQAKKRGVQKSVRERAGPPTFECCIEMEDREHWHVYDDVASATDDLLSGKEVHPVLRYRDADGSVFSQTTNSFGQTQTQSVFTAAASSSSSSSSTASDSACSDSGRDSSSSDSGGIPRYDSASDSEEEDVASHLQRLQSLAGNWKLKQTNKRARLANKSPQQDDSESSTSDGGQQGQGSFQLPAVPAMQVYLHGIDEAVLQAALTTSSLWERIQLQDSLQGCDAVLALRGKIKAGGWLRTAAKGFAVPIFSVKTSSPDHLTRAVQTILGLEPSPGGLFGASRAGSVEPASSSNSGLQAEAAGEEPMFQSPPLRFQDAMDEALIAVEQVVIPRHQPIELLPRTPELLDMQVAVVNKFDLPYEVIGTDRKSRLRIMPRIS